MKVVRPNINRPNFHLLERLFVERMEENEGIFIRFMNDQAFQKVVIAWMAAEAYRTLRTLRQADTRSPAGEPSASRVTADLR